MNDEALCCRAEGLRQQKRDVTRYEPSGLYAKRTVEAVDLVAIR